MPRWTLSVRSVLYRVHRRALGPWFFGSSGDGRFDLDAPSGTCYLATDETTAVLEVIGVEFAGRVVPESTFAGRVLRRLQVPNRAYLADLCVSLAASFGVTNELTQMVPYDIPQEWAALLDSWRFGGIRYRSRFDPGAGLSIALFGRRGERTSWPKGSAQAFDATVYARLRAGCGLIVEGTPSLAQVTVVAL